LCPEALARRRLIDPTSVPAGQFGKVMRKKVDVKAERRKSNKALELRTQKQKIGNQRDEIANLKRAIKAREEAISTLLGTLQERGIPLPMAFVSWHQNPES
jgi:hypothetical protein